MLNRITRAAAMRARGANWTTVGAEVKSRPEVCMTWPKRYSAEWEQATAAEQKAIVEETKARAFLSLWEMLRHDNERIRLRALRMLYAYERRIRPAQHGSIRDES
jgi:hypothetical protein